MLDNQRESFSATESLLLEINPHRESESESESESDEALPNRPKAKRGSNMKFLS